jgi:hypothetical protein
MNSQFTIGKKKTNAVPGQIPASRQRTPVGGPPMSGHLHAGVASVPHPEPAQ